MIRAVVVVKQTAYQRYMQLKARGLAPLALRWEGLSQRDEVHRKCVEDLLAVLDRSGCERPLVVGREELHHQHLKGRNLVIAVGGDGTALSASHFIRNAVPLLAVNSDPDLPELEALTPEDQDPKDVRRSVGALCCCTSFNMAQFLPRALAPGGVAPQPRARIRTTVMSTYNETTLPPALNDVLLAHPSPAAMSRFRVSGELGPLHDRGASGDNTGRFVANSRSSGLWVCTATGASGAMAAAGGSPMEPLSTALQWRIRDEAPTAAVIETRRNRDDGAAPNKAATLAGLVANSGCLEVRWNSQVGAAYIDGENVTHDLELGDRIKFSTNAPPLYVY